MSEPLSGWLKKLGAKGPRKTWKKRYFIQKVDKIYYYASKSDTVEKGYINLEKVISAEKSNDKEKGKKFWFQVNTPLRIYLLQAETQDIMDYWINGINRIIEGASSKENEQRTEALLSDAKKKVVELDQEVEKLKKALEFACKELGTTADSILARSNSGEQPKSSNESSNTGAQTTSPKDSEAVSYTPEHKNEDGDEGDDEDDFKHFGAQVLYDYNARKEYELTIQVNEIITVLSQHENGWWLGCNHAGKQGYFPGSYVRPLT